MLLVVDCSSAFGYNTGGLTVLPSDRIRIYEKPMRVTPWIQYQLVEQESDPDQLAPGKNHRVCGCPTFFLCFGRAAARPDNPSGLKVGPTQQQSQQQDDLARSPDLEKDHKIRSLDLVDHDDLNTRNAVSLGSSLKRSETTVLASVAANEPGPRLGSGPKEAERKKVQWTDAFGRDLFEVREFEPSEHSDSDDEFENGNKRACSCRVM